MKLTISSKPAGAEVYLAATGVKLGHTPLVHEMPNARGTAVFIVKLGGFVDARAELAADRDGAVNLELAKVPEPKPVARAPRVEKPPAAAPVEKKPEKRKSIKDGQIDPFAQ